MSRRCCGCDRPCLIFGDDFNRGDSTNLGSDWEEVAGDSEIIGNELSMPAGAVVMATTAAPTLTHTADVKATMKAYVTGDKYRVRVEWSEADDTFLFGEFEVTDGAAGTGWLRVGRGSVGGDTIYHELLISALDEAELHVCRSQTGIYVDAAGSTIVWDCQPHPGVGPWQTGLENAGSNTFTWDDFVWREHEQTNPDCDGCECECDNVCVGSKTLLGVVSASGDCGCLHGNQITVTWQPGRLPDWVWEGTASWPEYHCISGSETVGFRLTCKDLSSNWTLEDTEGSLPSNCGFTGPATPSAIQCDPLIIDFGPFTCEESGPFTCAWSIRFTESP